MIYEPAEDSFLLKKHVKEYAQDKIVLDLGTGSGILAEEAKKYAKKILAADINEEAIALVKSKGIPAVASDLFSNIKEHFDLILFNPPYLPAEEAEDEDTARITTGGKKGFEMLEKFLSEAAKHLNTNGKILLIASTLTGDVEYLFRKYNYLHKKIDEENLFFEKLFVYELRKECAVR